MAVKAETGERQMKDTKAFLGHETILYDTVMLDTLYHIFQYPWDLQH